MYASTIHKKTMMMQRNTHREISRSVLHFDNVFQTTTCTAYKRYFCVYFVSSKRVQKHMIAKFIVLPSFGHFFVGMDFYGGVCSEIMVNGYVLYIVYGKISFVII